LVASAYDWAESAKIEQILREDFHQFESVADRNKKKQILAKLQKIIEEWIQDCGRSLGMEESAVQKLGGKIFTFGSYRLNVGGPDSDIDSLVVAPRMIDRMKHFFGMLAPILKNNPDVTDLKEVPEAIVPVIKLKY
jgi:poly(A) polymerase